MSCVVHGDPNGRTQGRLLPWPLGIAPILAVMAIVSQSVGFRAEPYVDVIAYEFKFEPTHITAESGPVTFVVTNAGVIEHNFIIERPSGEAVARIPNIEVGKTEQVSADLAPGSYLTVCTLPGHREVGMVGTLTVKPSEDARLPIPNRPPD